MAVTLTILAVLIELITGYPDWLLRSIGHPVTWMGRLIAALEHRWNREADAPALRRMFGVLALVVLLGVVAMATLAIQSALLILPFGVIGAAILASTLIAQRSLHQHVARVADALERDGLRGGRESVSHLEGRDTESIEEVGYVCDAIQAMAVD